MNRYNKTLMTSPYVVPQNVKGSPYVVPQNVKGNSELVSQNVNKTYTTPQKFFKKWKITKPA